MRGLSQTIREEIEQMLGNLQFQDRSTQLLAQVRNSMRQLADSVALWQSRRQDRACRDLPDIQSLLADMKKSYVTMEQHVNHAPDERSGDSHAAKGSVNFF